MPLIAYAAAILAHPMPKYNTIKTKMTDAQFLCKHRGQLYAGIVHRIKAVGNT